MRFDEKVYLCFFTQFVYTQVEYCLEYILNLSLPGVDQYSRLKELECL